jgi:hypothetical protein
MFQQCKPARPQVDKFFKRETTSKTVITVNASGLPFI